MNLLCFNHFLIFLNVLIDFNYFGKLIDFNYFGKLIGFNYYFGILIDFNCSLRYPESTAGPLIEDQSFVDFGL